MVDPRGALEDEEEEEEGGEDWEDMPEREGRFDMVMNMIPGRHRRNLGSNKSNVLQQVEDLAPLGALIELAGEAGAGEYVLLSPNSSPN